MASKMHSLSHIIMCLTFKVTIPDFKLGANTMVGTFYVYADYEAFNYIYKCVYGIAY